MLGCSWSGQPACIDVLYGVLHNQQARILNRQGCPTIGTPAMLACVERVVDVLLHTLRICRQWRRGSIADN